MDTELGAQALSARCRGRVRPKRWLIFALPLVASTLFSVLQASPVRATPTFNCGYTSRSGFTSWTASKWDCAGDLSAQGGALDRHNNLTSNGGAAVNTQSSSASVAVPEECNDAGNTTCGRGEFGYNGGEVPFGAVLLNSMDPSTHGETFACPKQGSSQSSGTSAVDSTTDTTGTGVANTDPGSTPALLFFPGDFNGGDTGQSSAGENTDSQCYDPYEQCTSTTIPTPNPSTLTKNPFCSSANASNTSGSGNGTSPLTVGPGNAHEAMLSPTGSEGGQGTVWYIPNTDSNSNCAGDVLYAGGDSANAFLYDPNASHSTFNTWTQLSSSITSTGFNTSLSASRGSADAVELSSTRLLIAGGVQSNGTPSNNYDIFDATKCGFLPVGSANMGTARYDFGLAKFATTTSGNDGNEDVLACGGQKSNSFALASSCALFTGSATSFTTGGSWTDNDVTPSPWSTTGFAGGFAAALPNSVTSTGSTILVTAGTTNNSSFQPEETNSSVECTDTVSSHSISCSNTKAWETSSTALGYTPQSNTIGPMDMSNVVIGYASIDGVSTKLPGASANSTYDGLVMGCGGFAGGPNSSGGNDTQQDCEIYVPSGGTKPANLTCNGTTAPFWCTAAGLEMNRERAYFSLTEVPCNSTSTSTTCSGNPGNLGNAAFYSCGGFYGESDSGATVYVERKNCEYLPKNSLP